MNELLVSAPVVLPLTVRPRAKAAPQRSPLRLTWAVEPATGKLMAHWIVSRPEQADTVGLALAV